jgi:penicillin-binding protein 2
VRRTGQEFPAGGVVLTLDRNYQTIVQNALSKGCQKGAAVVLDVYTGDILAMESIPAFDQRDIAASLTSSDTPFINRAISGYNIGSAFKALIASAALEAGYTPSYRYTCQGYVTWADRFSAATTMRSTAISTCRGPCRFRATRILSIWA